MIHKSDFLVCSTCGLVSIPTAGSHPTLQSALFSEQHAAAQE